MLIDQLKRSPGWGEVCGAGCAGWNMEAVQTEGATDACRALVS